ncbi:hypothetical protein [Arcicella rosea]|uniref:Competence protein CoiA-like family protein n=1 Tax=Arcicella rosea TaxID=502909 RepID=A0A841EID8_9BACT|nr:hypothetical protein [Arcicella rosea]MBB6003202.1 hypothetical protein [Arcicella rosea]
MDDLKENKNTTEAYDRNRNYVNISNAMSGANGYYCIGCGAEMVAHKPISKISPYFRHHPKFVNIERLCTWSDESTRHKKAKDILQAKKSIKVPKVIKYPPDGNGPRYIIQESKFIKAYSVEIELSFYEDSNGNVKWERLNNSEKSSTKNFLIRPDVAFFDSNGKPILLIEIDVTHKIKDEKWLKIKRLGIDTVEVKIPRDSEESIIECFDRTTFTKWIFNNEEQNTSYFSISSSFGKRVSTTDEFTGGIHEETFKCRRSQIGNLIRAFERCLEQESYISIKQRLELEILEVENNTERESKQLRELQGEFEARIKGEFEDEEEEFRGRYENFRAEEVRVEGLYNEEQSKFEIETKRINSETRELEKSIKSVESLIREYQDEIRQITEDSQTINRRREDFRGCQEEIETRREELRKRRKDIQSEQNDIEEEEFRAEREFVRRREELSQSFTTRRDSLPTEYEKLRTQLRERMDEKERTLRPDFAREASRISESFDESKARLIEGIRRRDGKVVPELRQRFEGLLNLDATIRDIEQIKAYGKRVRRAEECFEQKNWKAWEGW